MVSNFATFMKPLFFLVAFSIFEVWFPCRICVCEASTISAGRQAVDWNQRRKDLEQRLLSGARIASDALTGKKIRDGFVEEEIAEEPIGLAGYRSNFAEWNNTLVSQKELKYGFGQSFSFQRFQSPASIRKAFLSIRSASSFRWFEGKDGRKGYVSSTKLGGDYVLAESEQIAIDCRTEDVLRVYLSGELQTRWNTKNCIACHISKFKKEKNSSSQLCPIHKRPSKTRRLNLWSGRSNDGIAEREENQKFRGNVDDDRKESYFYLQDLLLKSQRVIRSQTGPMRYQQIIEIDKVGRQNYAILVRLLKNEDEIKRDNTHRFEEQEGPTSAITTTIKKPFESLDVYVGLEQMGSDVKIYAAGVFEVNRKVVPKIIVFDTSGFAGSIAGKGTLWLAGYFEKASMKRRNRKRIESHLELQ